MQYGIESGFDENQRIAALSGYAGKSISVKIIEYDPERGRLVFSERAAQAAPGQRNQLLSALKPGERVSGVVTNVTRFGVFLDLGGLEGLIHVSELSWGRVRHPADVVRCGQTLDVVVLSIDREQSRVALSLKDTLPDPWRTVEERYHVGDMIEGTVTNVVRFGAFVGIEEGIDGLPLAGVAMKGRPLWQRGAFALMCFMTINGLLGPGNWGLTLASIETYRGHTNGYHFYFNHALAIALIVAKWREDPKRFGGFRRVWGCFCSTARFPWFRP